MINQTGLIEDPRSNRKKKRDWTSEELLAGAPKVEWVKKRKWKSYTPRNQKNTSSCVAQCMAKSFEVNENIESGDTVVFSASPIFTKRSNYPGWGMYLQDALNIAVKHGTTFEENIKSQNLNSDEDMAKEAKKWNVNDSVIAKTYASGKYAFLNYDMDEIAYFVSQGHSVSILLYFTNEEWTKYPKILNRNLDRNTAFRHCVSVVDFGLDSKGRKVLKVEDSAWFNGENERWITGDWLTRCFGAGVIFDLPNDEPIEIKPIKKEFTRTLKYGMRKDKDVARLQDLLKKLNLFPLSIPSTGNYLNVTAYAIKKFQETYKVASQWEINWLGGKVVGPKTRRSLNALL